MADENKILCSRIKYVYDAGDLIILYYENGEVRSYFDKEVDLNQLRKLVKENIKSDIEQIVKDERNRRELELSKEVIDKLSNRVVNVNKVLMSSILIAVIAGLSSVSIVYGAIIASVSSVTLSFIRRKRKMKDINQGLELLDKYEFYVDNKEQLDEIEIKNEKAFDIFELDIISLKELKKLLINYQVDEKEEFEEIKTSKTKKKRK